MADKLTLSRQAMRNRATAHLRIYVGNILDTTSEEDLYEHFIEFGQINGIAINRNFAFVQFETEQSAQDAIAKADGSMINGKQISVRTAQNNTDKAKKEYDLASTQNAQPPPVSDSYAPAEENQNDQYDNFGNFVGEQDEEQDDGYRKNQSWSDVREGRGRGRDGQRGRGARGRGRGGFRDRSPLAAGRGPGWIERAGFDRYPQKLPEGGFDRFPKNVPEYPRQVPVTERNDCEIIVVSKTLTEYAEYIEGRLKRLGIVVDLLYPMEDVPIGKVLGNIASRGCLYAILVMPQNLELRSLTLTILHGLPQEHRNMPLEDALQLLSRNFQEVQRGGTSGREAVYALLGQLADGRSLTVLQYDKVIEYLQERREQQVKIEVGEPPANNKTQVDLQQRILSILNEKKIAEPASVATPAPVQPALPPSQNKLLNDPHVRKALDSILQKFT